MNVRGGEGSGGARSNQGGFTLVELLVATVLFALGVTGLAGVTTVLVRETTLAGMKTRRSAAIVATVERIRAMPYDSVDSGADSALGYQASWSSALSLTGDAKVVNIVTIGPGFRSTSGGALTPAPDVADTVVYKLLEP